MTNDVSTLVEVDILPASVREDGELADIATAVRGFQVKYVESILEIGRLLEDARQKMARNKTGMFGKWVESECRLSKNSAKRAMWAFKQWGASNWATVAQIETTALYVLSSPSCPPEAIADAEQIIESGKTINNQLARDLVAKYKPEKETLPITDLEIAHLIRKAICGVYAIVPDDLKGMVFPKFLDFLEEYKRTGDLSW